MFFCCGCEERSVSGRQNSRPVFGVAEVKEVLGSFVLELMNIAAHCLLHVYFVCFAGHVLL